MAKYKSELNPAEEATLKQEKRIMRQVRKEARIKKVSAFYSIIQIFEDVVSANPQYPDFVCVQVFFFFQNISSCDSLCTHTIILVKKPLNGVYSP